MRRSVPWRLSIKGETTTMRAAGIRFRELLWADLHQFAPALEHEKVPDSRPADGAFRPLVAFPHAIDGRGFQDTGAAQALRRERFLDRLAQIARQPALKGKGEG